MNRPLVRVFACAALFAAAAWLLAQEAGKQEPASKEDAKAGAVLCPVGGEAANLYVKADTADGPVYFCCKDCVAKYEKSPADYAEKVAAQRAALAKRPSVQVGCPFSGEPVDKEAFIEHDGRKIGFCCNDCKGKFDVKNPEHMAKLAAASTYQTHCPLMGKEIDPAQFTDLPTGERVYWCCGKCGSAYAKRVDKFVEKLAAQGYQVDAVELKKKLGE